jgi:hypothetical protein
VKKFVLTMLGVALFVAGILSYYASSSPDGLERVTQDIGFGGKAGEPFFALIPDYSFPGLEGFMANGLAGIIGVAATYGLVVIVGKIIARRRYIRRDNCAPDPH